MGLDSHIDGLATASAEERVEWAFEHLPATHILSSSFGAQAAVMLHLVRTIRPQTPVVFIDTGFHFTETYRFVDELSARFDLNLKVYRCELSAAWLEARFGELWRLGKEGLDQYNRVTKVEPMRRAIRELGAQTWFSGIRRSQATTRKTRKAVEQQNGLLKVYPIIDWSDRDVFVYLEKHDLPYHPLWYQGYTTIGDRQLTRPLNEAGSPEEARFLGLKRECGLHERWG